MMMGSFMGSGARGAGAGQSLNPSAFWKSNVCATYFDRQAFSKAVADQRETTRMVFDQQGRQARQDLWQQTGLTPQSPQALRATLLAGVTLPGLPQASPVPVWLSRFTAGRFFTFEFFRNAPQAPSHPSESRQGFLHRLLQQAQLIGQVVQQQFGRDKSLNQALREEEAELMEQSEMMQEVSEDKLVKEQFKNVKQAKQG
jgi:hypothetical protein